MKKYYFNDGTSQQGPFTIEELKGKNISPETPVWYDGLPDWTTAGQLDELKDIFVHTPPPFHAATVPVEEVKPVTTATPAVAATVTASTTPAAAKLSKKSTAWLSYVLALLVLGGVGYLVYQDMEKNKGNTNSTTTMMIPATDSAGNTSMQQPATEQPTPAMASAADTAKTATITTANTEQATTTPVTATTTTVTPTATKPATVTTTKPTATKPTPAEIKAKQAEAQKLAQKKAEAEKKELQAAQAALAAAAKEKDYRNNWPKYITFGKLEYNTKGDGIDAFNVPVFNSTNAMVDKVTVRVDYMKKDKKVVKSETIFVYNIPPGAGLNGKAPEYKKGNNVKVFITGITSRKLHFCFPANNGNPGDPYFCN
jgi:chemotaxis protein histidine kinase CheA